MSKKQVVSGRWEVFQYRNQQGNMRVISFDFDLAQGDRPENLDTCYRVTLHLMVENLQPGGLPVEGMVVQLEEIERDLITSLETAEVNARMVGRMTFEGKREMVFQVEDETHFEKILSIWLIDFPDFRPAFQKEAGWTYYEENLIPTATEWQQVADRQMIEKLLNAGSHPQKAHLLEHALTGPDDALNIMAEELEGGGFQVLHKQNGQLVVQRPSYLNLEEVSAISGALFRFATDVGVQYEGWGARVVT